MKIVCHVCNKKRVIRKAKRKVRSSITPTTKSVLKTLYHNRGSPITIQRISKESKISWMTARRNLMKLEEMNLVNKKKSKKKKRTLWEI